MPFATPPPPKQRWGGSCCRLWDTAWGAGFPGRCCLAPGTASFFRREIFKKGFPPF